MPPMEPAKAPLAEGADSVMVKPGLPYLDIIRQLQARGAQAVILGCTEISLLVQQADLDLPLFDTTALHAIAAADAALIS